MPINFDPKDATLKARRWTLAAFRGLGAGELCAASDRCVSTLSEMPALAFPISSHSSELLPMKHARDDYNRIQDPESLIPAEEGEGSFVFVSVDTWARTVVEKLKGEYPNVFPDTTTAPPDTPIEPIRPE